MTNLNKKYKFKWKIMLSLVYLHDIPMNLGYAIMDCLTLLNI